MGGNSYLDATARRTQACVNAVRRVRPPTYLETSSLRRALSNLTVPIPPSNIGVEIVAAKIYGAKLVDSSP